MKSVLRVTEPSEPADGTLLQRFAASGDGLAFAQLVQRYGGLVLGLCRRLLRHEQDAEDAFQATFLVLARKAGSIRDHDAVGSWLYGVAHRVARKSREQMTRPRELTLPEVPDRPANDTTAPEELGPMLDEAVNQLPPKYRGPVVLCYLQGRTTEDASRALGCPRGTVLSRLARARERLRSRLFRRGFAMSAAAMTVALCRNKAAADVPLPLAYSTIQVAAPSAAVAGALSTKAVVLSKGVLKAMWIARLTKIAVGVLIVTVAAAGVWGSRAWAERESTKDKDSKPATLDGTWVPTAVVKNGNEPPKEELAKLKIEFKGDTFTLTQGDKVIQGTVKVDPTKKPATIDIELSDGGARAEASVGIYELDGDSLKICTAHTDVPRPSEFSSKEGSGHLLLTLKRAKP